MKVALKKSFVKTLALLAATVSCFGSPVSVSQAQETKLISGVPIVRDSGTLIVNGQTIKLWGIDTLAPDQQCWQGDQAWPCGAQATMLLRHFLEDKLLECQPKYEDPTGKATVARCFRNKGARKIDVAHFLVVHGLAMEHGETSGGAYFEDENEAQDDKRGIWSGRFQTAQDWRDGIQRFVGEDDDTNPADLANDKNHKLDPDQDDEADDDEP